MPKTSNYLDWFKLVVRSGLETLYVSLCRPESSRRSKRDIENISFFFIFSLGRSGTQFFTRLLNCDKAARVFHEPAIRDVFEYAKSFNDNYNFNSYIEGFRKKFIRCHIGSQDINTYGEANSYLRRHASAIMALIPNVKGLFLIRDGREVVRSMMSRGAFSDKCYYNRITPKKNDTYFSNWQEWGQFEKCCWMWAAENSMLYRQFGAAMKFELLLKDYDYFKANLIDRLKLDISESIWRKERLIKSENQTTQFTIPSFSSWSVTWQSTFWQICGEMMEKHGYN